MLRVARRRVATSLVLFACLFRVDMAVAHGAPEAVLAPLPLAEALRVFEIGNRFRVSPDAQWVAYALRDWSKRALSEGQYGSGGLEGQDVWIVNIVTGAATNLTEGRGSSWGPVWSPDGGRIAFISDRAGQPQLWIWDKASGRSRRVSEAIVRQYGNLVEFSSWDYLQWTPDGRRVLTKLLPEDMTSRDVEAYTRTPGGEHTSRPLGESAVTVYKGGAADAATGPPETLQQNWRQKLLIGDLGLIEIATGHVHRLARRTHAARYQLSPDGSHLAYLHATGWSGTRTLFAYDLVVTPVSTANPRVLVGGVRQFVLGMAMVWSPDSRAVAYLDGPVTDARVVLVAREDSRQRRILFQVPRDAYYTDRALPVWDAAGTYAYLASGDRLQRTALAGGEPDTVLTLPRKQIVRVVEGGQMRGTSQLRRADSLLFVEVRDGESKRRSIYRVNPMTGDASEVSEATDDSEHSVARQRAVATGTTVIYSYQDAQHMTDLWVARPDGSRQQLTHANPVLDAYVLGEPRLIEWVSTRGVRRSGALLLPAGYQPGRRYPLVVWVNGNDALSDRISTYGFGGFRNNMHVLATRGYAVLFPDSSVETGTPMSDIAANVLPGIDRVIEMGVADPGRLGVFGHSYGGYSTLALITQTSRFRAAISYAGLANLASVYGRMDENGLSEFAALAEDGVLRMGGSPWDYRERYVENSPWVYLDRVQTPLLLVCGDEDRLATQSDEVFVGLRRLQKTVEYAKYRGIGHTIGYYPALLDYWSRVIAWFDTHLAPPASATVPVTAARGR